MAKILFYFSLLLSAGAIFAAPWLTAVSYSAISLLQPQYVWFWVIGDFPAFKVFAGFAIFGLAVATAKGLADYSVYKTKQSVAILLLWIGVNLSEALSPFPVYYAAIRGDIVLAAFNSIIIMYFVILPLVYSKRALMGLTYVMVAVSLYYAYWANSAYFNGEWHKFVNGRLEGPVGSPYRDGNTFSVLLVMAIPFLAFYFFTAKKWFVKWGALAALPFIWHALFLFSSRGALLSSLIVLAGVAIFVKSKKFNIMIALGFVVFLAWQGSTMLNRSTSTVASAQSSTSEPVNPRLVSWEIGLKLIPEYPLFGVGPQRFQMASSIHFPGESPHVAHNTFLQFATNSGLMCGLIFLYLNITIIMQLRKINREQLNIRDPIDYCLASSSLSILGFFICSIFLDLIIYEPFYFCLIVNLTARHLRAKQNNNTNQRDNFDSLYPAQARD